VNIDLKIDSLRGKLEQFPDSPLELELAGYLLESGNVPMAISHCKNGVINYPEYLTAYLLLSKCFIANSEFHHAYLTLQKADKIFPLQKSIKQSFEALEHFKNAIDNELDYLDKLESLRVKRHSEKIKGYFSSFDEMIKDHKDLSKTPSIVVDDTIDDTIIEKGIEKIEVKNSTLDLSLLGDEFLTIDDFEISRNTNKKYKVLEVNELGDIKDRGEKSRINESISKHEIVQDILLEEEKSISQDFMDSDNDSQKANDNFTVDQMESVESDIFPDMGLQKEKALTFEDNLIPDENSNKKNNLLAEIINPDDLENIIGPEINAGENIDLKTDESEIPQNLPSNFVNRTLANIYESQGKYQEAIDVYNQLFLNETISQDEFNQKTVELQSKLLPDIESEKEFEI
jgi:tetratricopeptide (TPR) repeat protein